MARVVELRYYPIKGCAGTSVPDAVVTPAGLSHDRSFMVISDDGTFRSQRRDPRLALVHPEVTPGGERLTLRADSAGEVTVEVDLTAGRRDVVLFGAPFKGIDQGDEVAGWLSDLLGAPSRLVRVPPEHDRIASGETPGTSGYADSSPIHITSVASLRELNDRIAASGGQRLPMNRFRPNLVVAGWPEPHLEDRARRITVGDAELAFSKLAIRCATTLVDQAAGVRVGPEPIRTLASYRRTVKGVSFGVKFAVLRPGKLSVGDEVSVTDWGASPL